MTRDERPLSPHLQIYRLALGTVLSGLHRLAGLALALGLPLLAAWLAALAGGAESYARASHVFGSLPVRVLLLGLLAAFWLHACTGLRHLAWDAGFGFERGQARASGIAVAAGAALGLAATLAFTPAGRWLAGGP